MGEKLTYGISNVHYAPIATSESGVVTYGAPVRLPGASEIALSTVGDPVKVFADNIVYVKFHVNQGYEGDLSIFSIPDGFARDHIGMMIDGNSVLVEIASAEQQDFALLFEFNTETAKTKRTVLYNVSAGRPEINSATKEDSIDPEPYSIPVTAAPAPDTEYVKASITGDTNDPVWAAWFSSVYTPAATAQYPVTLTVSGASGAIAGALAVCGGKFARTDAAGKAVFMLSGGAYDILVSAAGYTAKVDSVTVSAAAAAKTVTMTEA